MSGAKRFENIPGIISLLSSRKTTTFLALLKNLEISRKHTIATRWFHWVNFPVLGVMVWSGLLIYWANDVYRISIGNISIIHFFPDSFYEALNMKYKLAKGMGFHFLFMWLFFLNGLLYVLYTILSGVWRDLVPVKSDWKNAWLVVLADLHIRRERPVQGKYNAAQKIAYFSIIVMGIGSVATGLAIYKPVQLNWLCAVFGGYESARAVHFILTIGYCLFFLVHIVQVIIAGWQNFAAMVRGFEVKKVDNGKS